MDPLPPQTIPGIDTFVDRLKFFGSLADPTSTSCAKQVSCGTTGEACESGNNYMELKKQLLDLGTYRCDLFNVPGSDGGCDPKTMQQEPSGEWKGDCIQSSGEVGFITPIECDLPTLNEYFRDFDERIELVFRRVDLQASQTQNEIDVNMRKLVKRFILDPIDGIADGAGCGFLSIIYREFVDGLCFQGAWGLISISKSYVGVALLALVLVFVMYIVWRIGIDNLEKWQKVDQTPDQPEPDKTVETPVVPIL